MITTTCFTYRLIKSVKLLALIAMMAPSSVCIANNERFTKSQTAIKTIVSGATRIEFAHLRLINVEEAENTSLTSGNRIAGYPIEGQLTGVNLLFSKQLMENTLNIDDDMPALRRCANQHLLGFRFIKDTQLAELALGLHCNQAIWAYKSDNEIKRWGGIIHKDFAREIFNTFGKK